ncbi:DUF6678 family protein [Pseudovibrio ascidiaceicola]|uniref:DUF6678 family protein n=1 Tax=Pseudovibrio ascidiaceicola TaxID=285279 RepID=UPI003D36A490
MTVNLQDDLDRTRRFVLQHYSSALMSNTKWHKLFAVLSEASTGIEQIIIKFVDNTNTHTMQVPRTRDLNAPRSFIDTIEFGPIELCAIEWIKVPKLAKPRIDGVPVSAAKQDIDLILTKITKIGQLPIEVSNDTLKITGYIR